MSTQLFPLPLFYVFPLVVTHSRLLHSFTGIYTQSKWGLHYICMNAMQRSCGLFNYIIKSINLLNPFSFTRRWQKAFRQTETWGSLLKDKIQVMWKKEYSVWMLRERRRCLQSSSYSQRTRYSCINAFHDETLGSLLVWWTIFPPS